MCGIAGIIYRNGGGPHRVGRDMTRMLQSMKHRGPDSTGFALYRAPTQDLVVRVKLADSNAPRDLDFYVMYAALRHAVIMARIQRRAIHFGEAVMPEDPDDLITFRLLLEELMAG